MLSIQGDVGGHRLCRSAPRAKCNADSHRERGFKTLTSHSLRAQATPGIGRQCEHSCQPILINGKWLDDLRLERKYSCSSDRNSEAGPPKAKQAIMEKDNRQTGQEQVAD